MPCYYFEYDNGFNIKINTTRVLNADELKKKREELLETYKDIYKNFGKENVNNFSSKKEE